MSQTLKMSSNQTSQLPDHDTIDELESTPPTETIPVGSGRAPWIIRYMMHLIILWSVGYVILQPESNYINYITAVLLVLWSAYNLLAMKKKWPPFP